MAEGKVGASDYSTVLFEKYDLIRAVKDHLDKPTTQTKATLLAVLERVDHIGEK